MQDLLRSIDIEKNLAEINILRGKLKTDIENGHFFLVGDMFVFIFIQIRGESLKIYRFNEMEKGKLYEFENEQAFEDYLISFGFNNWEYFQQEIPQDGCKTVGLFICGNMVSAARFHVEESGDLFISAMQTKNGLERNGYGSMLINLIIEHYCNDEVKVKWTDKSLGFWMKSGFDLSEDLMFVVR